MDIRKKSNVLVADDEKDLLYSYQITLKNAGIKNVFLTSDSRKVLQIIGEKNIDIILLDLSMPYITGEELLPDITQNYPDVQVIIITGNTEVKTAVRCLKQWNVFDYLTKPIEKDSLIKSVDKALKVKELKSENIILKELLISGRLKNPEAFSHIITHNEKMRSIFRYMEAISSSEEPVLITGETGVGKELIADAFYKLSNLSGPFVSVNVAGLDDQMFADTLFGHKKGSFTNAINDRTGLVEKASNGMLFLDEIGDLSVASQIKLLRLLQEKEYYPIGSDKAKISDTRVIVATNSDLNEKQEKGDFRKDLFYRLNVHNISIPPLRERKDDIPLLVEFFTDKASKMLKKKKPKYSNRLLGILKKYEYPGNIRELRGLVFDAVSTAEEDFLTLNHFKNIINENDLDIIKTGSIEDLGILLTRFETLPPLKDVQYILIEEALRRHKNNQTAAAKALGITRQTIRNWLVEKNQ